MGFARFDKFAGLDRFRVGGGAVAATPVTGFETFMVRQPGGTGWEPFMVRKADGAGWETLQVRSNG